MKTVTPEVGYAKRVLNKRDVRCPMNAGEHRWGVLTRNSETNGDGALLHCTNEGCTHCLIVTVAEAANMLGPWWTVEGINNGQGFRFAPAATSDQENKTWAGIGVPDSENES